jgi:hypothetical protein
MPVAEEFVKSRLGPYEQRIRGAIEGAWADYLSISVRHKFLYARTRANVVFDLIAGRILVEFDADPDVKIIQKDETVKILIEDVLLVRIKKANGDGLGSNIPTQAALAFVAQEPEFPGLLPDVFKIEVCYFEGASGADIAAVRVTARDNDEILWSYELGRSAGAEIIPFPSEDVEDAPLEVEPRKVDKRTDQTEG